MCFELTWVGGLGGERWEAQNFAFFFPVPPQNLVLCSLSGGLLVESWWCLKRRDAQMCTFGVLGLSCETPADPFLSYPGKSPSILLEVSNFSTCPTNSVDRWKTILNKESPKNHCLERCVCALSRPHPTTIPEVERQSRRNECPMLPEREKSNTKCLVLLSVAHQSQKCVVWTTVGQQRTTIVSSTVSSRTKPRWNNILP